MGLIRQATVEDVSGQRITRIHGQIIVVTQYYPRYLRRNLIHEYARELAPARELLEEFKERERATGDHDGAFDAIDYESKFTLTRRGLDTLGRLTEVAKERDVYLVCHCKIGQRCHREILMIVAEALFQARIGKLSFPWSKVRDRLPSEIISD